MTSRYERGIDGENAAARFLAANGYNILARNFRTPRGEVDIICEAAGTIVFVEVKRWSVFGKENLEYAISTRKQRRIAGAAQRYLADVHRSAESDVRFDVVFIQGERIEHLKGAFDSPWPG
jgi:putative endonuclease